MKKLLWLLLLTLSACATTGRSGIGDRYWIKSDEAYVGMDDAVSMLYYANYARNLSAAEREREVERQRIAYSRDKSDLHRLQYALVLSTPEAGANDRKLAQQLLDPMQDGKHDSGLAALAALLNAHLNALSQAQQQGIQQGQKRIDELEKKLDAVKDIERSLLRREKGKL
jgi:hypothetical protein